MTSIIIPYVDPDLDGVACAIALSELYAGTWNAHVFGEIDDETKFVLDEIGIKTPTQPPNWSNIDKIWLVDTHHTNQLPGDIPMDLVSEITDHHPSGEPEKFPNATIENERVGAAATLVTERYFRTRKSLKPNTAILLQAAIISNTLDFNAPATSERDKSAFSLLQSIQKISSITIAGMVDARSTILSLSTFEILQSDTKIFDGKFGSVIVAQIEVENAVQLLARDDLADSLDQLKCDHSVSFAVLVLVDLYSQSSAVIATDASIIRHLSSSIGSPVNDCGAIWTPRLLQRKSDIIPVLK